jgi:hypothetical protein
MKRKWGRVVKSKNLKCGGGMKNANIINILKCFRVSSQKILNEKEE